MVERREVDGRDAMVAFFDLEFVPTSEADAELIRVVFLDDNSSAWLVPKEAT